MITIIKNYGNMGTNNRVNVMFSNGQSGIVYLKDGYSDIFGFPVHFERNNFGNIDIMSLQYEELPF